MVGNALFEVILNGKKLAFNEEAQKLNFSLNHGTAEIYAKSPLFVNYAWEGIALDQNLAPAANKMRIQREFVEFDELNNERKIDVKRLKSAQSFYIKITIDADKSLENVAITQTLPSGWEIENTRLNQIFEPEIVRENNAHAAFIDIRDDKIIWFVNLGEKRVVYVKINAVTPGLYTLPPAYVEAMYDGRFHARTGSFSVRVE